MAKKYLNYYRLDEQKPPAKKFWTTKKLNVLAIVGVASAIGYYTIKKKILGSPPSKIRKGLLYASLAGLILYKCENEKVINAYKYVEDKVEYRQEQVRQKNNYLELKNKLDQKEKTLELKVEELSEKNKDLYRKERAIDERKIELENIATYVDKKVEVIEYQKRNFESQKLQNENEIKSKKNNVQKKEQKSINAVSSEENARVNYKKSNNDEAAKTYSNKTSITKPKETSQPKKVIKRELEVTQNRHITQEMYVARDNFVSYQNELALRYPDTIRTITLGPDPRVQFSDGLYLHLIKEWIDLQGDKRLSYRRVYFDGR